MFQFLEGFLGLTCYEGSVKALPSFQTQVGVPGEEQASPLGAEEPSDLFGWLCRVWLETWRVLGLACCAA